MTRSILEAACGPVGGQRQSEIKRAAAVAEAEAAGLGGVCVPGGRRYEMRVESSRWNLNCRVPYPMRCLTDRFSQNRNAGPFGWPLLMKD